MATTDTGTILRQLGHLFGVGTVAGLSDAQLLERYRRQQDEAAFTALVARHGSMVWAVCRGILRDAHAAEDAFQATFLILVRRAGTLWVDESLGGWLHRVAHRVALQAQSDAARRRAREHQAGAAAMATERARQAPPDRELCALIHTEIGRLPDRLRLPLVLCDLEGLTRDQAAGRLKWTEGTLRGRLARARLLLRRRLTRHGVVAPVGTVATVLARDASAAILSERLLLATVRAAAGRGVAPLVTLLTARVVGSMLVARLKTVASAAAGVATLGTAAWVIAAGVAETGSPPAPLAGVSSSASPAPVTHKPVPSVDRPGDSIVVRGRVVDPSGQPVAGARVCLWVLKNLQEPAQDPAPRAQTDADGRFQFLTRRDALPPPGNRSQFEQIVATAPSYGAAWFSILAGRIPDDLTLRLAEDLPIEGRILNLEGRPVAGARVGVLWMAIPENGVGEFLSAVRNQAEFQRSLPGKNPAWLGRLPGQPAFVACDAAGRFRLSGFGRDRLVELVVQGPGIADGTATVLTRPMAPVVGPASRRPQPDPPPPMRVYGAGFDHVAPPSRPIMGVVRGRDTGAPLAGVRVVSRRMPGKDISGEDLAGVTTDAAGGYLLDGHPKTGSYAAAAVPGPGSSYLVGHIQSTDTPGTGPVRADIFLARGIPFRVRPVDVATGRPVPAEVRYYPLHPNPQVRGPVGFGPAGEGPLSRAIAHPDGSYTGVVLPGPGAICIESREGAYLPVRIHPRVFFKPGQPPAGPLDRLYGDETFLIVEEGEQGLWFLPHEQFHAIVLVNPAEGAEPIERDISLVPARSVEVTILAPDGQPLSGAEVYHADDDPIWSPPLPGATFQVTKVDPNRPRKVFIRHREGKLAGMLVIPTAGNERPSVRLHLWATLSGRLVDAEGRPRPGLRLETLFTPAMSADPNVGEFTDGIRTDPAGRFHIEGLVPGLRYSLHVMVESAIAEQDNLFRDVNLGPGETQELGDVKGGARGSKDGNEEDS